MLVVVFPRAGTDEVSCIDRNSGFKPSGCILQGRRIIYCASYFDVGLIIYLSFSLFKSSLVLRLGPSV